MGGDAATLTAAGGSKIGAVGALRKPVGEMGVPCVPVGGVEVGKLDVLYLDVVGVRLTVEEGVVDAEFKTFDACTHEYLAGNMAEKPTFDMLAEGGVEVCYDLLALFACGDEGFERGLRLRITACEQLHWARTGALDMVGQGRAM